MDLHGIVAGAIGTINPFVPGTVKVSTGPSATAPDGTRTPTYRTYKNVLMQVQALSYRDLAQIEGLNLNGDKRAIYIRGRIDGIVRSENKGGDLIILTDCANAGTWLVVQVLEQWPDWCKVAVTLQNP